MAVNARNGRMSSGKLKPRIVVLHRGECRPVESGKRVAGVAAIQERRFNKLLFVSVFMTVGAIRGGRVIVCFVSLRLMALPAGDFYVFRNERVLRSSVLVQREDRRLERADAVTGLAFPPIRASQKLAVVAIRMTIDALRAGDRLLEIRVLMASNAGYPCVRAFQRISSLVVIEAIADQGEVVPSARGVALGACVAEFSKMRIAMAVRAIREGDIPELASGSVLCG
jgi:hypothetical protein